MASTLSRLSDASATSLIWAGRLSRPRCPGSNVNPNLVAMTTRPRNGERFPKQLFVDEWAVRFGGVEECHPAFDCRPNQGDSVACFKGRTIAVAQPHTAKPQRGHFEVAAAECAFLHHSSLTLQPARE